MITYSLRDGILASVSPAVSREPKGGHFIQAEGWEAIGHAGGITRLAPVHATPLIAT